MLFQVTFNLEHWTFFLRISNQFVKILETRDVNKNKTCKKDTKKDKIFKTSLNLFIFYELKSYFN